MTCVLLAMDETDASVRAAERARALFGDGSDYVAVSVATVSVEPAHTAWLGWSSAVAPAYGDVWQYASPEGGEAASRDAERAARANAERADVRGVVPVGGFGDPAEVILQVAADRDVDVIVVGGHDRGWLDRLFHPSVSAEIVKDADRPVLVVH